MPAGDAQHQAAMSADQLRERRFIAVGGELRKQIAVGRPVAAPPPQVMQ